jgi:hypothetical protein
MNGVVDARGFTGTQPCGVNMFVTPTGTFPTGKLLLGNVLIKATVPQIQPSKFLVEGTGWTASPGGASNNTVIQATSTLVSLGQPIWCFGVASGTYSSGYTCPTAAGSGSVNAAYGALAQYLTWAKVCFKAANTSERFPRSGSVKRRWTCSGMTT